MTTTGTAPPHGTGTAARHAVFHPLRVAAVERLTADSVAVAFEVPGALAGDYRFLPGQHVSIRSDLGGTGVRRNYSICEPVTSGRLRVGVKRIPGGAFSSYALERLAPGDVLDVMTPTGRFGTQPDPAKSRHCVAIAAGSGITPILSILTSVLAIEPASTFTLLYGNRTAASVMFADELGDTKDRYPTRFALHHFLSREPQEAPLPDGRLDSAKLTTVLSGLVPAESVDEWFVCGPPAMIAEAQRTLLAHGAEAGHVHRELFHADGAGRPPAPERATSTPGAPQATGPAAAGSDVRVILDGRQTRLAVAAGGEPILDAVLRARADAPYSCRGGVCGTCRARVIEGTVRMDHSYALEAGELAAGYVLTCQSHPASPSVVLDYDA